VGVGRACLSGVVARRYHSDGPRTAQIVGRGVMEQPVGQVLGLLFGSWLAVADPSGPSKRKRDAIELPSGSGGELHAQRTAPQGGLALAFSFSFHAGAATVLERPYRWLVGRRRGAILLLHLHSARLRGQAARQSQEPKLKLHTNGHE